MSTNSYREQLGRKFVDKEYRDAFVEDYIFGRLPLKIYALRESRGLSQKELGDKIGVAQTWVSKLEDPNYGKLTLSTLLRLASAFDVAIEVDFVPFSKVLDDALSHNSESWKVPSFAEDMGHEIRGAEISQAGAQGLKLLRGAGVHRPAGRLRANTGKRPRKSHGLSRKRIGQASSR